MFYHKNENTSQANRSIATILEPYFLKKLQLQHHTFFVFKCDEYKDFDHFTQINKILWNISDELKNVLQKYWKTIDIIYTKISEVPKYVPTKEYFNRLYSLQLRYKTVFDVECYEIKASKINNSSSTKLILSRNSFDLKNQLEKCGKKLHIITIMYEGYVSFTVLMKEFNRNDFEVYTHYGRRDIQRK